MVDTDSESAAMDFALRKCMDGAMCKNDGSMGEMGLRRCMLTVGLGSVMRTKRREAMKDRGKEGIGL